MSMQLIFLGTAGGVPTPSRGLPSLLLQRKDEQFLFDCGEGAQRQIMIARAGFHRIAKIFITHMHGDHVLGLPGLLQTMAMLDREKVLEIYGPARIESFLESLKETVQFALTFPVKINEITRAGIICDEREYTVRATWSKHAVVSVAYAFIEKPRPGRFFPRKAKILGVPEGPLWSELQQGRKITLLNGRTVKPREVTGEPRPGRKIVYVGDTVPFKGLAKFASNADLLVHDSTLADELAERAEIYGHSTSTQAAKNAKEAKARRLVLTHISSRYADPEILLKQAKEIFKNTLVAEDFMQLEIPLPSKRYPLAQ